MTDTIVMAGLGALFLSMMTCVIKLKLRGHNAFSGAPPVNLFAFILAKLSASASILFMLGAAAGIELSMTETPAYFQYVAVVILVAGLALAIPSLFNLGDDLKFGLPEDGTTKLETGGLYAVSRNPLYAGFYLIVISSCVYVLHPANVLCAVVAIAIHHRITLSEELYLLDEYGDEFNDYMSRVRRYL